MHGMLDKQHSERLRPQGHPYDFRTLRYCLRRGKAQESTTNIWMRKFGFALLKAMARLNAVHASAPIHRCAPGTARGQFLPDIEYKLEPVEGVSGTQDDGDNTPTGRLCSRTEHHAWLFESGTKRQISGTWRWYDTGDIVNVEAAGYVHISAGLNDLQKVSGEMVSLTAVDDALAGAFPKYGLKFAIAVVAKPDEGKGGKTHRRNQRGTITMDEVRAAIRGRV